MDTKYSVLDDVVELINAGMPAELADTVMAGIGEFWRICSDRYPEVESGDSLLVDEPRNIVGSWLCDNLGIVLDRDKLPMEVIYLDHDTNEDRFEEVLNEALDAAQNIMRIDQPSVRNPSEEVSAALRACLSDMLRYNFPDDCRHRIAP